MRAVTNSVRPLLAAIFLLNLVMLTQGCTQLPGLSSQTLPPDPGDPCQQERATFATSDSFFTANVLDSAGAAALLGAEKPLQTSFNASSVSSSSFSQTLDNMAAGAMKSFVQAVGSSANNSYSDFVHQQFGGDRAQMADRVDSDLAVEGQARDQTITNFTALRDCRFDQAAIIKQEAREHTLTHSAAKDALDQERAWFDQEIALATKWGVNMQERDDQFAAAAEAVEPPGSPEPERQGPSVRRYHHGGTNRSIVVAATETIPDKREALVGTVSRAKAESATAFNTESDDQGLNFFRFFRDMAQSGYA
jgi:hypothetical protein